MNYYEYDVEDFLADDYFKNWVIFPDEENEAFWRHFLSEFPEKYHTIETSRTLVTELYHLNEKEIPQESSDAVWQRIDATLQENKRSFRIPLWFNPQTAAASIGITLAVGLLWMLYTHHWIPPLMLSNDSKLEWVQIVNKNKPGIDIKLADGSQVYLHQNSTLKYPKNFAEAPLRQVTLEGMARFDIHKDPSRPFLVYAQGLVTKVLGTSFIVKAPKGDTKVTVSVNSGKVSLYSKREESKAAENGIVLTPNQQAVFETKTTTFAKSVVDHPEVLDKVAPPSFYFNNESAVNIFKSIEQAYGIDILYDEELMSRCKLNLDISQEDLYQKLNIVCKVLNARFEMIDAKIIIYSPGC
ncbi:uncharacterized protein DUF4974 [Dyadobacter jejuensis]|uniref:Uncharacterized protein DUF4974 n=1 Tax=Dyadobacter jejuensis TaxID=1082580 RepID=A0A316AMQ9_9BACT|nr:FecR family protein [Dyadobacter jejuensis]PWJ58070.1 uncharacterized protein DUF4974 [Dyadobacter jejuensis]